MERFQRALLVVLLGAGLILSGSPMAYGQEEEVVKKEEKAKGEEEKEVFRLEEVVVTAEKREQNVLEVPLSISAFDGTYLEARGISTLRDLLDQVPGVSLGGTGRDTHEMVYMRGSGVSSQMGDSTVGHYLDDSAFSFPNFQLAPPLKLLYDIERAEVLRGPQGTTYGQGSMGGTIKLITRQPDLQSFGGKAQVAYADTDGAASTYYRYDAVLNTPIVKDRFGVRLILGYEHRPGFGEVRDHPEMEDPNKLDTTSLRIKALWQATDNLSITLSHWLLDFKRDFDDLYYPPEPGSDVVQFLTLNGAAPNNDRQYEASSLNIEWDLPFGQLVSTTGYFESEAGYDDLRSKLHVLRDMTVTGLTQEVRLLSGTDSALRWLAGVYYQDIEGTDDLDFVYYPALTVGYFSRSIVYTQAYAVFGNVSYAFLDGKLVPTVGFRYFEDQRDNDLTIDRWVMVPDSDPAEHVWTEAIPSSYSETFDAFTPRFTLAYFPTDDSQIYINAAKGFRSGFMQDENSQIAMRQHMGIENPQVQPDELWSYELGTNWQFLDGGLIAQAAAFTSRWKDIQWLFYVLDDAGVYAAKAFTNLGEVEIYGVEWDFQWRPTADLRIGVNGAWTGGEWGPQPSLDNTLQFKQEGDDLNDVAEWTHSVNVFYRTPVGSSGLMLAAYGNYVFRSETRYFLNDTEAEAPFEDLSLWVGVEKDNWALRLYANNVLDEVDNYGAGSSAGIQAFNSGARPTGRTIGIRWSYSLGR